MEALGARRINIAGPVWIGPACRGRRREFRARASGGGRRAGWSEILFALRDGRAARNAPEQGRRKGNASVNARK